MPSKIRRPPTSKTLWNRFAQWCHRLFFGAKPNYPKQIGEPTKSKFCTLYQYERFEPRACQTWRAISTYYVTPPDAHIFLLCDSLEGVARRNKLSTHRLTLALMSSKSKQKYWSEDFEMTSDWGEGNCAWIVTRLLAGELLRNEYTDINWSEKAAEYVRQNRRGITG
jgi:hypothetical protein